MHPRRTHVSFLRIGLLTLLPVLVVSTGGAGLFLRVLTAQGDVTGRLGLPAAADELLQRDELAYPVHAAFGEMLNGLGGSPVAAGVQWLKAADHAASDAQLERAMHGVNEAAARDGDGARVRATVCPRLNRILDQRPTQALIDSPVRRLSPCPPA